MIRPTRLLTVRSHRNRTKWDVAKFIADLQDRADMTRIHLLGNEKRQNFSQCPLFVLARYVRLQVSQQIRNNCQWAPVEYTFHAESIWGESRMISCSWRGPKIRGPRQFTRGDSVKRPHRVRYCIRWPNSRSQRIRLCVLRRPRRKSCPRYGADLGG